MPLIDRLVHPVKLSIKNSTRGGADATIEYTGTNWLLLAGSKICTEYSPSALSENYHFRLKSQRKWAVDNRLIDNNTVLKSIGFKSLSALNTFVLMSPASYQGVNIAGTGVALRSCLENYRLYNKYIAHCNYYDKDWNVIADSDRSQAEPSISDSLDSVPQPTTKPQSLQDISTSDIINELASRIINISKQWGG
jgi:hypothetical protein